MYKNVMDKIWSHINFFYVLILNYTVDVDTEPDHNRDSLYIQRWATATFFEVPNCNYAT